MLKRLGAAVLASVMLLACGCSRKPPPTVNESMTEVMAPQAQTVWDITSRAFNDKGDGLEPSKISPTDWARLESAGRQLKDRSLVLAKTRRVTVAAPGETIMGQEGAGAPSKLGHAWDAATAKQIQARIDANPALFAQRARTLAESGDIIAKAARAKDVRKLYGVSSDLDEVCDGCHERFWGTDQPPPFPK